MEVVVPTSSFPRDADDWRGRFVLDLSRALARRGHQIVHVVPDPEGREDRVALEPGIDVRRVSFGPRIARGLVMGQGIGANIKAAPWRLLGLPGLVRALGRGIEAELEMLSDARVLSHWLFPAGLAASRLARRRAFRHVTVVHGGALQNLLAWPGGGRFLHDWADGCDAALYVSEDLRRRARARLKERAPADEVSPMGVAPERFGPRLPRAEARELLGIDPDCRLVVGLGRLIPLKGFDLLVEAAAGIPDLRLVIAGEGPEEARLVRRALALGVELELPGALAPAAIGPLLDAADRLVVPSRLGRGGRSEGCPVAALEALSRGLGVLATRSGGLPELLAGRADCALFPVDDRAELARLLRSLRPREDEDPAAIEQGVHLGAPWDYTRISGVVESLLLEQGGRV